MSNDWKPLQLTYLVNFKGKCPIVKEPHASPLTLMVVGAPQMTLQQYLSAAVGEYLNPIPVHSLMFPSLLLFLLLALSPAELSLSYVSEDLEM